MKQLDLTELGPLARELSVGETIELTINGEPVARVEAIRDLTPEEYIDVLAAQGKVRKGTGKLPDWFFEERPPQFEGSVLQQLLDDRRSRDW
jgi:antitoxin (DNA-binding transcriptional repressor) of toxin-antitoxin stability system